MEKKIQNLGCEAMYLDIHIQKVTRCFQLVYDSHWLNSFDALAQFWTANFSFKGHIGCQFL